MSTFTSIAAITGCTLIAIIVYDIIHIAHYISITKKIIEAHQPFGRRNEEGEPRIAVFGDSTALGTGASKSGSTIGHFSKDFPEAHLFQYAENGWKVIDLLNHFPDIRQPYDLIILQIGANDIIRFTNKDQFEKDLRALFKKAHAHAEHVVALHSGNIGAAPFFPWPLKYLISFQTRRYKALYEEIARQEDVSYVDLYKEASEDQFQGSPQFYAPDYLHLTDAGYDVWYKEIRLVMREEGIGL